MRYGLRGAGKFVKRKKHLSELGGEERRLAGWQKWRHKTRQMWVVLINISHALFICVLVYLWTCLHVYLFFCLFVWVFFIFKLILVGVCVCLLVYFFVCLAIFY